MANFAFVVHRVTPGKPEYNVVSTQSEGWKVKSRLKSTEPKRTWDVEIRGRTWAEKESILSHYTGQQGFNVPFNWIVTPNWFTNGSNTTYYVRYKDFSMANPPGMGNVWEIDISFIEEL